MDLGKIISKAAPALGSVVSSMVPGAGLIINGIAALFGGDADNQKDLAQRIQNDPEATMKLIQFEKAHARDLLELTIKDREDARNREIEHLKTTGKRDWVVAFLGLFVTFGFFGVIVLLCFINPTASLKETFYTLVGQCSSAVMLVLSYYFGSMNLNNNGK